MIYKLATYSNKKLVTIIQNRLSSGKRPVTRNQLPATSNGFTLMEILLAFLILGIVVTTVLASFNAVFSTTDTLNNSSRYFDTAKNCLNRMTLDLEALYVRQPPLFKKPEFDDPPDPFALSVPPRILVAQVLQQ